MKWELDWNDPFTPIVDGTYWTLEYDNARLLNISLTHGVNNRSR